MARLWNSDGSIKTESLGVDYDPTVSGLAARTVKEAIDELASAVESAGGGGGSVAKFEGTTESISGGGSGNLTIDIGFPDGYIPKVTWEPVSNASVTSAIIKQYADSARSKLIGILTGDAYFGAGTTDILPRYRGMGGMVLTVVAPHRSEDNNIYLTVENKTGGEDGTIKITLWVEQKTLAT